MEKKKTFSDMCHHGTCDVCGKETDVVVCGSGMGPISYAYCEDCLLKGLEPYGGMVAYISCAGKYPDDIAPSYRAHIQHILKELGKTEEEFIADCDKALSEICNGLEEEITIEVENGEK